MCGIVAFHRYGSDTTAADHTDLRAMSEQMASRGPDGSGFWHSDDGNAHLAHRRLAIIGLGDQGAQPMSLPVPCASGGTADSLSITYNGEVYNYLELQADLIRRGHRITGGSDTEVILHLYEEFGPSFVSRLRGMFAFALWDGPAKRMLLARDPYGIKPLYYRSTKGFLCVASQVRPLASRASSITVDEGSVAAYLLLGSVPEPSTIWREIKSVPAGSYILSDRRGPREPMHYFSVHNELRNASARRDTYSPQNQLRDGLNDSVTAHLIADVNVGLFLSSGLDSAAILAVASERRRGIHAITLGFEELRGTPSDEVPIAAEIAKLYGAMHTISLVSKADFVKSLPALLAAMDQPTIDGVNSWFVSRASAAAGLKVALSGLGGDEALGGYPTFFTVPRTTRILRWPAAIPGLGAAGRRLALRLPFVDVPPKAASLLEYGRPLSRAWYLRRALFLPWELPELLGQERARHALQEFNLDEHLQTTLHPDPGGDRARVAALESAHYMRNQLLRDVDWASMAHSVEVRVPFVDSMLIPALAPVMLQQRRPGDAKRLLAAVPRHHLPDFLTRRPKTGFTVPMAKWLTDLADHDSWRNVPSLRLAGCHWSRRWAYIVASNAGLFDR